MNWYFSVLKKYAVFEGRARRKEYWMFTLVNMIVTAVVIFIDNLIGWTCFEPYGWLSLVYALVLLLPSLGVCIRRLHDTGRSGWWYFIVLVPLIGPIWLIVLFCKEGNYGTNEYGEDPKAA